jgi:DNA-binding CsgD family transcriptional regulator
VLDMGFILAWNWLSDKFCLIVVSVQFKLYLCEGNDMAARNADGPVKLLTEAQEQVMKHFILAKTYPEIGLALFSSVDTVKAHVRLVRRYARRDLGLAADALVPRTELVDWYRAVYLPRKIKLWVKSRVGGRIQALRDGQEPPTWNALYMCLLHCSEDDSRVDGVPEELERALWPVYGSGVVTGICAHLQRWKILREESGGLVLEGARDLVAAYEAVWPRFGEQMRGRLLRDLLVLANTYPSVAVALRRLHADFEPH